MTRYGKTENLFVRDDDTHKLVIGVPRSTAVPQIKDFIVTEKIDGTNIRLILDWAFDEDHNAWRPVADVRGRTDDAVLPKGFINEAFGIDEPWELTEKLVTALAKISGTKTVTDLSLDPLMMVVYGEGYGAGINKGGGRYSPTKQFRAFDVKTYKGLDGGWDRGLWRQWVDVFDVAVALGVKTVPLLSASATLEDCVERVRDLRSAVAAEESGAEYTKPEDLPHAEGLIARTDPYLYDSYGHRVFFKLKARDMP